MRIAFMTLLSESPWGGSEPLWTQTAGRALDEGHDVAIVAFRVNEATPQLEDLERRGAKVFLRARRGGPWRSLFERAARKLGWTRPRALRALDRWAPQFLVVNQGGSYQTVYDHALRAALGHGDAPPFALVTHHNADGQVLSDADRATACAQFEAARWVAFVSESNRRAVERQLAMSIDRAWIAKSPVDLSSPKALPWPDDAIVRFACVARLDARVKGQEVLLDVLGGAGWSDRRWQLHLYGKGQHLDYLKAVATHVGIAPRVTFHGHVDHVETIWRENHVLVLPSRSEGTPLAVIEAMLCGRPSIVTDVGGNAEWLDDGVEGFLAPAPTATAYGAAMERAWAARIRWREIGLAAHERAMRQRDPDPAGTLLFRILGR